MKYKIIKSIKGQKCSIYCFKVGANMFGNSSFDINDAFREVETYNKNSKCGCKVEVKAIE